MTIPRDLKKFLIEEDVCALGVSLPNGEVHTAPVLYWCDTETLKIYFSTGKNTEKMSWRRNGQLSAKASVAVGLRRKVPYLVQMRGTVQEFDLGSNKKIVEEYEKRSSDKDDITDPDTIMICFTPTWARYTNREDESYAQVRLI